MYRFMKASKDVYVDFQTERIPVMGCWGSMGDLRFAHGIHFQLQSLCDCG